MVADRYLTPTDVKLLGALASTTNLVRAARTVGISRDRAVYRLERIGRLYGKPAAAGHRGRGATGSTTLTPFGRRLLAPRRGEGPADNRWEGVFHPRPGPHVDLAEGRSLTVAFRAHPGERVTLSAPPEAFLLARRRFESSARNVLRALLTRVHPLGNGQVLVEGRWEGLPVRAAVTASSARRLRLAAGESVYFYLKAIAVRKVPSSGAASGRPTR